MTAPLRPLGLDGKPLGRVVQWTPDRRALHDRLVRMEVGDVVRVKLYGPPPVMRKRLVGAVWKWCKRSRRVAGPDSPELFGRWYRVSSQRDPDGAPLVRATITRLS